MLDHFVGLKVVRVRTRFPLRPWIWRSEATLVDTVFWPRFRIFLLSCHPLVIRLAGRSRLNAFDVYVRRQG